MGARPRQARPKRSRTRWYTLAAVCAVAAGFAAAPAAMRALRISQVRQALAERQGERALELLAPLIERSPDSGELRLLLARANRRVGRLDQAAAALKRAENLGYPAAQTRREWVLALAQSGRMAEAEPELKRLLLDPGDDGPEICEAFVSGYFMNYEIDKGLALLEGWERDYPADPQPHVLRGKYYEQLAIWEKAGEEYKAALKLAPDALEVRARLGRVLLEWREYGEALAEFERCLARDPQHMACLIGKARCLHETQKDDEARAALEAALKKEPASAPAAALLGEIEFEAKNLDAAVTRLREAVERNPRNPDYRFALAKALQARGDEEAAAEHYQFADEAKAASAKTEQAMTKLVMEGKELKPQEKVELRCEIGSLALRFGEPADGLAWLHSALQIDPSYGPAHKLLAEYYASSGNAAQAAEHQRMAGKAPQ